MERTTGQQRGKERYMQFKELIKLLCLLDIGARIDEQGRVCLIDEQGAIGPFLQTAIAIHRCRLDRFIRSHYHELEPEMGYIAEELVL